MATEVEKISNICNQLSALIETASISPETAALSNADISALFATLRATNRQLWHYMRDAKQRTMEGKQALDKYLLEKHNLSEEKQHLEREIKAIRQIKWLHEQIELAPTEEVILPQEVNTTDFMRNRLLFEHQERERLAVELEDEQKKTSNLRATNETTRNIMYNLRSKVADLGHHYREISQLLIEQPEI